MIPGTPRTFTLWVCPKCGFYTADEWVHSEGEIHCFPCGEQEASKLDFGRINSNWHHRRREMARETAPLMVRIETREVHGV